MKAPCGYSLGRDIVHTLSVRLSLLSRATLVSAVCSIVFFTIAAASMVSTTRGRVPAAAQTSNAAAAPGGNAENGKRLYTKYGCYPCHGRVGQGSPVLGPRLGPDPVPFAAFTSYLRKPAGQMPPYTSKVVSDQELADIYAFLESLAHPPDAKTIPLLK
jgi:hypothetical protein